MKLTDNNEIVQRVFLITKQLKGAPLREYEKRAIREELAKAEGTPLEQTKQAVTKVLHAPPAYIDQKRGTLEDVNQLMEDIRMMARRGDPK